MRCHEWLPSLHKLAAYIVQTSPPGSTRSNWKIHDLYIQTRDFTARLDWVPNVYLNFHLCCWPPHPEDALQSDLIQGWGWRGASGVQLHGFRQGPCLVHQQQSILAQTGRTNLTSRSGNPRTVIYVGCKIQEIATGYIAQRLRIKSC